MRAKRDLVPQHRVTQIVHPCSNMNEYDLLLITLKLTEFPFSIVHDINYSFYSVMKEECMSHLPV